MMIGIYALTDKRADDAFLAAVLTVIGYSVMDTIVILDRIRENVKVMAGESYAKIVNASILQTMTRSVNTLATVVITLVALLAFGGASLQNFAFALLVGICSGGYHSIFYSAPLVSVLRERQLKAAAAQRAAGRAVPGADRPRTVAEAKATAASAASREAILAARKERRAREKAALVRQPSGPARYKRKRGEAEPLGGRIAPAQGSQYDAPFVDEAAYEEPGYEETEYGQSRYELDQLDPLDAQNAGLHDHELSLGHEEIHLNLGDELDAEPIEHPATLKHE